MTRKEGIIEMAGINRELPQKPHLHQTKRQNIRKLWNDFATQIVLTLLLILTLIPLIWVWISAFRERVDIFAKPFGFPSYFYCGNFIAAWTVGHFGRYMINSIIVAIPTVILGVALASLAAYGMAVLNIRGSKVILNFFLLGMMIPLQAMMIPLYYVIRDLKMMNTYFALILPEIAVNLPFGIYMLYSFFSDISQELVDSAVIDGCSPFQTFKWVVLPISKPALTSLTVFFFMWVWNSFLIPLLVIHNTDLRPLSLGIMYFQGRESSDWALIAAGVTIMSLPIILVYLFMQKQFVKGMTSGAIKG
jgi:raffinose/stachyose/melibiose transport system permease protein